MAVTPLNRPLDLRDVLVVEVDPAQPPKQFEVVALCTEDDQSVYAIAHDPVENDFIVLTREGEFLPDPLAQEVFNDFLTLAHQQGGLETSDTWA